MRYTLLVGGLILFLGLLGLAQSTRPAAEADESPAARLGVRFTSLAAGLSFRPPAGGVQHRRLGMGTDIVQYLNTDEKWSLKVSRLFLETPTQLVGPEERGGLPAEMAQAKPGLLDEMVRQLRIHDANTQILRKEMINVGPHDAGVIVSRYTQGAGLWLRQQAFVKSNDQVYYVFDFNTPSGRAANDPQEVEDPAERMAVGIFDAMLDSVRLLDQTPVIEDNNQRLYRTRALLVSLPKLIEKGVVPEQYFRLVRQGKDIGWSFMAETLGQHVGRNGVFVNMASHLQADERTKVNMISEMFCALDLKTADELWATMTLIDKDGKQEAFTEIGQSDKRIKRILDESRGKLDKEDPRQPPVRLAEVYTLDVKQRTLAGLKQVAKRDLAPYYLPQALGAMLPHVLPISEPKTYLFVSWVPSEQELIHRYLDVEAPREVELGGKKLKAAVIRDRIGLEGEPTLHYIAPDGKYLGSFNQATGVSVIATDAREIMRRWPEAKFVNPKLLEGKEKE